MNNKLVQDWKEQTLNKIYNFNWNNLSNYNKIYCPGMVVKNNLPIQKYK